MKNVGTDLFSRLVAKQVFSAPHSLTSVFGMGTGGPCAMEAPTFSWYFLLGQLLFLALNGFKAVNRVTALSVLALTYFPGSSPSKYLRLRTA